MVQCLMELGSPSIPITQTIEQYHNLFVYLVGTGLQCHYRS